MQVIAKEGFIYCTEIEINAGKNEESNFSMPPFKDIALKVLLYDGLSENYRLILK